MSQENVEIVRGGYDGFNEGDVDAGSAELRSEIRDSASRGRLDTGTFAAMTPEAR